MVSENKKLSIRVKIILVSLCFTLPLVVLAYFVVVNIDENKTIAEQEVAGDAYQMPLEALLRDTLEHQRLVHHCPAGEDCKTQIAALQDGIAQSFTALKAADQQYGTLLEFTPEGLSKRGRQLDTKENLEKTWNDIADSVAKSNGSLPTDIDAKYDSANGIINAMIAHVGDTSTLILDPELDTYHFVVDTLLTFPQNQNRIEAMIATARTAYSHGAFTLDDRVSLGAEAAQLQNADIDQATADTNTAIHENGNEFHPAVASFQQNIPPAFKDWSDSNSKLVAATKALAVSPTPPMTFDEYTKIALVARSSSFHFWSVAIQELDNLLRMRADYYAGRRTSSLLLSGASLLLSCIVAYIVTRSMVVPLNKLALTLMPGANLLSGSVKQISDAASERQQDPEIIRIICGELTAHASDMRQTATNLEVLVLGHEMEHELEQVH